jgi:hypothetical protein
MNIKETHSNDFIAITFKFRFKRLIESNQIPSFVFFEAILL